MKELRRASADEIGKILQFYAEVIEAVNQTDIKLGWRTDRYPDEQFLRRTAEQEQLLLLTEGEEILAAAVVNHEVNPEYHAINWQINSPDERIAIIHALAVSARHRGCGLGDLFLKELESCCRKQGDTAIHLDVIDTNIPAYKLYERNGYEEAAQIEMYYEVVGKRTFWMFEKVFCQI